MPETDARTEMVVFFCYRKIELAFASTPLLGFGFGFDEN